MGRINNIFNQKKHVNEECILKVGKDKDFFGCTEVAVIDANNKIGLAMDHDRQMRIMGVKVSNRTNFWKMICRVIKSAKRRDCSRIYFAYSIGSEMLNWFISSGFVLTSRCGDKNMYLEYEFRDED